MCAPMAGANPRSALATSSRWAKPWPRPVGRDPDRAKGLRRGAIWHHHELTYAVVLPAHHRLARPSTALYQTVHAAILDVLRGEGLDPHRRADRGPARQGRARTSSPLPFLCFTDRDPEDIVADGFKVVGMPSGAGPARSSSTDRSCSAGPANAELRGISDLAETSEDPRHGRDSSARDHEGLGLAPVPLDPSDEALLRATQRNWCEPSMATPPGPPGGSLLPMAAVAKLIGVQPLETRRAGSRREGRREPAEGRRKPRVPEIRTWRAGQASWISETLGYDERW